MAEHAHYSIELAYEPLARAHRVLPLGFDGANFQQLSVDSGGRLQVEIVAGGSAGVQYTEGDIDASITGTAVMWEDAADTLRAVSAGKPLPVAVITGGGGGSQFDDGDAIDTDSQGNLLIGTTAIPGTARAIRVEDDGSIHIHDGGNSITVDGTVSVTEPVSVDDNGGSLTVDNPTLSVVGGGTEATALRVTIASDSTGLLSIDDNGGSLTVDGTVSISGTVTVDTELPAAAALADDTANPTVPSVGALSLEFDGSTEANWDRVRHSYYQPLTGISGAGAQAEIDMSECPMSRFSTQEFKTGTVTAYNYDLQGSNDGGANWFLIVNNTSGAGTNQTVFAVDKPARRFRINVVSKVGAGTIAIHTLASAR